jgi:hypothetical protein
LVSISGGTAIFGWMKDTVKSGVQKAKSSVDNLVVTLDPQVKVTFQDFKMAHYFLSKH